MPVAAVLLLILARELKQWWLSRRTTARGTTAARSAAAAPASTTAQTPPSPPSPTPSDRETGPAEPSLWFAIEALTCALSDLMEDSGKDSGSYLAAAFGWLDETPALDAAQANEASSTSTSVKPGSPSSALASTPALSLSPSLANGEPR